MKQSLNQCLAKVAETISLSQKSPHRGDLGGLYLNMKKMLLLFGVVFMAFGALAQDITGEWNGVLSVQGMKLRLVFHVSKTDAGYTATMDSPDQGARGIPMTSALFENNVLTLEHKLATIVYTGTFDKTDSIAGKFTQAGQSFPLTLHRKAIVFEIPKRSQEPVPPFPYVSEEVTFVNTKENIRLAGTFTFPKEKAPLATVVLISGSGPQNRDEELMGHKPFLVLADHLTRNGIAVLRFDDRGSFASEGNFATATSNDFATDVEAAMVYLKTRKEVNKGKIGLIGHSEGGLIAPMVAVRNKDVNFIVLMAGPGIPGSEILLRQQALIGRANGVKEDDLKASADLNTAIFKMIDEITNTDTLKTKITNYLREQSKTVAVLAATDAKKTEEMIEMQLAQLLTPWMLNFIRYNPSPVLEEVQCPVLAINGSKDLQVPSAVNLNAIETALNKAKNKHFVIKELAGLNHLFQECNTGSPNEYAGIEQTISPSALEVIAEWIGGLK